MNKISIRRRLALGIGASAMLVAAMAGPALAANAVTQAITGSGLTASVADLTLPSVAYQNGAHNVTGTMILTADDSTGSGAGWNVTIQSSDFIWVGTANGGIDIPAVKFALTSAAAPTLIAGQAIGVALLHRPAGPADLAHRHPRHPAQDARRDGRLRRRHLHPGPRRHPDDPGPEPRRRLHGHAHDHDHLGSVAWSPTASAAQARPARRRTAPRTGVRRAWRDRSRRTRLSPRDAQIKLALLPVGQAGSYFDLTMRPGETRSLRGRHRPTTATSALAARTYAADVYTIINGGFGGRLRDEPGPA